MRWGAALVLAGTAALTVVVAVDGHPAPAAAAYVLAGAGMGFGYPRTSVAMLDASTGPRPRVQLRGDLDRGLARRRPGAVGAPAWSSAPPTAADADPFLAVFVVAVAIGVLATLTAARTARGQLSSSGSVFSRISSSVTPGASSTSLSARSPRVPETATSPVAGSTTSMTREVGDDPLHHAASPV